MRGQHGDSRYPGEHVRTGRSGDDGIGYPHAAVLGGTAWFL